VVENKEGMWCYILSFLQLEFNVYLPSDHMVSVLNVHTKPENSWAIMRYNWHLYLSLKGAQ